MFPARRFFLYFICLSEILSFKKLFRTCWERISQRQVLSLMISHDTPTTSANLENCGHLWVVALCSVRVFGISCPFFIQKLYVCGQCAVVRLQRRTTGLLGESSGRMICSEALIFGSGRQKTIKHDLRIGAQICYIASSHAVVAVGSVLFINVLCRRKPVKRSSHNK